MNPRREGYEVRSALTGGEFRPFGASKVVEDGCDDMLIRLKKEPEVTFLEQCGGCYPFE